jgi:hypothetical protein
MGTKTLEEIGAGDQGHMFGYASDETPELMPLTHVLATQLGYKLTEVRKNGVCGWLRPDGEPPRRSRARRAAWSSRPAGASPSTARRRRRRRARAASLASAHPQPTTTRHPPPAHHHTTHHHRAGKTQVTVEYKKEGGAVVPQRVHTILISTQHNPDVTNEFIHKELMEHVIKPVVPAKYLDDKTIFHLNPSGRWGAARRTARRGAGPSGSGSQRQRIQRQRIAAAARPAAAHPAAAHPAAVLEPPSHPQPPWPRAPLLTRTPARPRRFVIGGPHGDAGLTGRKIIIDTYGGWGAHGGGAFSGKDPTKVDRSGGWPARSLGLELLALALLLLDPPEGCAAHRRPGALPASCARACLTPGPAPPLRRRLHHPPGRQVCGRRRPRPPLPGAGLVRHRRARAPVRLHRLLRHQHRPRAGDPGPHQDRL